MKRVDFQFILVVILSIIVSSLIQTPGAQATPMPTTWHQKSLSLLLGKTIVINSTSDSGPGSLREAIESALPGDSITFDPSAFSPISPDTISLISPLPALLEGNLVIDASNMGVVIDGSNIILSEVSGLSVVSSNNTIRGLHLVGFSKAGIAAEGGAQYNTIGGDRDMGEGPLGQGNRITGNGSYGIFLHGEGTSFNTMQGNVIGTDPGGTMVCANFTGGIFQYSASYNFIVANLIGGYKDFGIYISNLSVGHNTISDNIIGTDPSGELDLTNSSANGISIENSGFNLVEDNLIGGYMENGVKIRDLPDGHNTISGNYIGTNPSGEAVLANSFNNGIYIEHSGFNIVGPANKIAYNGGTGIAVFGENSKGNYITRNSIHDNAGLGIEMWDGGNTELAAPVLIDFDKQAGTVTGIACDNCIVELFSDSTSEGAVYEGQTTTNNAGNFTFNKGGPFVGPSLTATATDSNGNTSQFSVPTPDTHARTVVLQEGNNLPKIPLQTKRSEELADNRIGGGWKLNWIYKLGAKRARLTFNVIEEDRVDWSKSEFTVTADLDNAATSMDAHGVIPHLTLSFWDKKNHPGGWEEEEGYSRFQTQEEIERYIEFVQFNVKHFKDRIQYYELWNEPDNGGFPAQYIQIPDYINLVKQVVPVIRQEYPEAKIMVGSVSNLIYNQDYMFDMVNSEEIMQLVDVICWHPFYGQSPAYEDSKDYYDQYPSIVQAIKDTAFTHGFRGEYFVDEIGWAIEGYPSPTNQYVYTDIQSAKYHARAIVDHLGLDVAAVTDHTPPYHVALYATIRNLCTVMAGTKPDSVSLEIQSAATNIRSYGFSLPDGEKLIALWTDSVALDYDPGVNATLVLTEFSDQNVMCIDVLTGLKQGLITEVEGDNLIIRNLMVKDYPIIISSTSDNMDVPNESKAFSVALHQNYPNPFDRVTRIKYNILKQSFVTMKVFDLLGREVATLANEKYLPGSYEVEFDAKDLPSGFYFYRIKTESFVGTKIMILTR